MYEIIKDYYGVNLNETRNQIITDSWDMAQQKVRCCCYIVNQFNFDSCAVLASLI